MKKERKCGSQSEDTATRDKSPQGAVAVQRSGFRGSGPGSRILIKMGQWLTEASIEGAAHLPAGNNEVS